MIFIIERRETKFVTWNLNFRIYKQKSSWRFNNLRPWIETEDERTAEAAPTCWRLRARLRKCSDVREWRRRRRRRRCWDVEDRLEVKGESGERVSLSAVRMLNEIIYYICFSLTDSLPTKHDTPCYKNKKIKRKIHYST